MFDLTDRQKLILKIIVEEYISTAEPISSSLIIEKFLKNLSSATVRNEMLFLEKSMLLEKTHTSSGRIPSTVGYKYYHENILSPKINNDIKTKLLKILNNRELGIDSVIDQSVQIIQENLHLPVITQTFDNIELLKRFDLIRITEYEALVIFVTSSGNITKSTIVITNNSEYEDVAICVRVFNDRLVDTPIKEIKYKLDVIKEIIKSQVHEYENVVRTFIEKIFSNNTVSIKSNVVGTKFLTSQPEFQNIDKLNKVLEFLEDTNVWKMISYNQQRNHGLTSITFGSELSSNDDVVVASTTLESNSTTRHLSIVGPSRMDYGKVKSLLDFIKEELEKGKFN